MDAFKAGNYQAVILAQVAPRGGHARMPGNCVCVSSVGSEA